MFPPGRGGRKGKEGTVRDTCARSGRAAAAIRQLAAKQSQGLRRAADELQRGDEHGKNFSTAPVKPVAFGEQASGSPQAALAQTCLSRDRRWIKPSAPG